MVKKTSTGMPVSHEELRTKPLTKEDEYFLRQEMDRERELAKKKAAAASALQREKLRELHYMHCPGCGEDLIEQNINGLKVNRCPNCNGLWLDSGDITELEKRALQRNRDKGVISRIFSVLTQ